MGKPDPPISPNLDCNEQAIRHLLGDSTDVIYRGFTCGYDGGRQGLVVYVSGLTDGDKVERLTGQLLQFTNPPFSHPSTGTGPLEELLATVLHASEFSLSRHLNELIESVLSGETAVFLEGEERAILLDTRSSEGRSISEPKAESEVRGPKDGFVENLGQNIALLRRRVRDPRLRVETVQIGKRTSTNVALIYMKELAADSLVKEVYSRLDRIELDGLLGIGYVEEMIRDSPLSMFSLVLSTERPDRVTANLLEGRVAILSENTPLALVVPTTFWMLLQAPGDYYQSFWVGSAFRWIRFLSLLMALILPALYVMLATFHQEMIPTPMALNVAGGREGTPLPTLVEVLLMTFLFEVLNEAGLRLPQAVGQSVSIVGGLVVGQAAVQAGLVAPATVIVVATAGLNAFALPSYSLSLAIRIARIPLLLASGFLGVFGFVGVTTVMALHLASLRSFGEPYLAPVAPMLYTEQQDTMIRAPWFSLLKRPKVGETPRTRRQPPGQMPSPRNDQGAGRS